MQTNKLYVGNLLYGATNDDLQDLFSEYGTVTEVKIIEGRGFGFVEMSSPEEAENAMEKLDGYDFKGRTLKVSEARPQRERGREGRSSGPGRGGRRGNYSGGRRF
jgi:RNA recognition motif-containing protein